MSGCDEVSVNWAIAGSSAANSLRSEPYSTGGRISWLKSKQQMLFETTRAVVYLNVRPCSRSQ